MQNQEVGGSEVFSGRIDSSGRLVLPAAARNINGIKPGDAVVIVRDGTGIHIQTPDQALASLKHYFKELISPGVSLTDELIAERRAEALGE